MKKLSVIAMVAMTALASTSCISFDEDEIPGTSEEYGYIKLSASADDVMVTRANQSVATVGKWYAYVTDGTKPVYGTSENGKKLISEGLETTKMLPGTNYAVYIANYATEDAWKSAEEGFGDAYYKGERTNLKIDAGIVNKVDISCGKAQNAKFNIESSGFAGPKLKVNVTEPRALIFSTEDETIGNDAFFDATATLKFTMEYTINGKDYNTSSNPQTITLAGAGTANTLTISSDQNGTIKVTITYDRDFNEGKTEEIEIDSATGTATKKQS